MSWKISAYGWVICCKHITCFTGRWPNWCGACMKGAIWSRPVVAWFLLTAGALWDSSGFIMVSKDGLNNQGYWVSRFSPAMYDGWWCGELRGSSFFICSRICLKGAHSRNTEGFSIFFPKFKSIEITKTTMLLHSSCLESEQEAKKLPELPKYFRLTGFCRWADNKLLKRALKSADCFYAICSTFRGFF